MKKILAILGDYYHEEWLLQQSLDKAIETYTTELEQIEIEYIKVEQLAEKLQEQPDVVILSKGNKLNPKEKYPSIWLDEILENQICQYVYQGGGWFSWHSGLSSYESFKDYYSMIRGKFDFHPNKHQLVTYQNNKENVLFQVLDEHYFVTCEERKTDCFLYAISGEGKTVAGWRHEYGKGRVICLTPSHTREGLLNLEFCKLLSFSLKWCSGILA